MRELRLDSQMIIQLLGDPEFFNTNAAFVFMQESSLAAVAKYQAAVLNKETDCDGCGSSVDESTYVNGTLATFVSIMHKLHSHADQHPMERLREFIASKLGYCPDSILLMYKSDGKTTTLEF